MNKPEKLQFFDLPALYKGVHEFYQTRGKAQPAWCTSYAVFCALHEMGKMQLAKPIVGIPCKNRLELRHYKQLIAKPWVKEVMNTVSQIDHEYRTTTTKSV